MMTITILYMYVWGTQTMTHGMNYRMIFGQVYDVRICNQQFFLQVCSCHNDSSVMPCHLLDQFN